MSTYIGCLLRLTSVAFPTRRDSAVESSCRKSQVHFIHSLLDYSSTSVPALVEWNVRYADQLKTLNTNSRSFRQRAPHQGFCQGNFVSVLLERLCVSHCDFRSLR